MSTASVSLFGLQHSSFFFGRTVAAIWRFLDTFSGGGQTDMDLTTAKQDTPSTPPTNV